MNAGASRACQAKAAAEIEEKRQHEPWPEQVRLVVKMAVPLKHKHEYEYEWEALLELFALTSSAGFTSLIQFLLFVCYVVKWCSCNS